jgi:hypothetical protein
MGCSAVPPIHESDPIHVSTATQSLELARYDTVRWWVLTEVHRSDTVLPLDWCLDEHTLGDLYSDYRMLCHILGDILLHEVEIPVSYP